MRERPIEGDLRIEPRIVALREDGGECAVADVQRSLQGRCGQAAQDRDIGLHDPGDILHLVGEGLDERQVDRGGAYGEPKRFARLL